MAAAAKPAEAKPAAAEPAAAQKSASLLARLGVYGLSKSEPAILGALISGEPLLLVGAHGTGKTHLLLRLCEALGLSFRHYNASLLSYDDLVGYPLPNAQRELEFVQTPASIWGAQAVFLDEISRCRPELQNKLFSIVHERRVQGIALTSLEYRWAAMNPPPPEDDEGFADAYRGSEALDAALADRFAFIVSFPDWQDLDAAEQTGILLDADLPVPEAAAGELAALLAPGRVLQRSIRDVQGADLARYVRFAVDLLRRARIVCSPRRAAVLLRNIAAVHAARLLGTPGAALEDSAYVALCHSLPHPACGLPVDAVKVLAAHREAWQLARLEEGSPLPVLLSEPDPLRRALLATRLEGLDAATYSTVVADALAEMPTGARHALAATLFESDDAGRLVAAVAEQCAELYLDVATPQDVASGVGLSNARYQLWQHVCDRLSAMSARTRDTTLLGNLLAALWKREEVRSVDGVDTVVAAWQQTRKQTKQLAREQAGNGGRP